MPVVVAASGDEAKRPGIPAKRNVPVLNIRRNRGTLFFAGVIAIGRLYKQAVSASTYHRTESTDGRLS